MVHFYSFLLCIGDLIYKEVSKIIIINFVIYSHNGLTFHIIAFNSTIVPVL